MLALDGIPISQCDKNDPFVIHVNKALSKIRRKEYWKLVPHTSRIRKAANGARGLIEYATGVSLLATGKYNFHNIEHDVTYYTTKLDGIYRPRRVSFSEVMPLNRKNQADLIFFMTCVSPFCAPYPYIEEFQYLRPGVNYHYMVEDLVEEAKLKNVANRDVAKVNTLIFDDDIGIDDETLKNIAVSHGFPNAKDMDIELLKLKLAKNILAVDGRGEYNIKKIRAFLDDCKDTSLIRLRSIIRSAIEKKYLIVDKTPRKDTAWYYTDDYGKKDNHLVTVPKGTSPEVHLVKHMANNQKERQKFELFYKEKEDKASRGALVSEEK